MYKAGLVFPALGLPFETVMQLNFTAHHLMP